MRLLEVEVDDTIYEVEFGQVQIEITGRCNMKCQHCRAAYQERKDMEIPQIIKIISFARQFSPDDAEIVISGGEPLIHRKFFDVIRSVRSAGVKNLTLTTNGVLLTEQHLRFFEKMCFKGLALSVSLDNLNPTEHDAFRKHKGAFEKANQALRLVAQSHIPGLISTMRSTIQASQIGEMGTMVEHARSMGCKRIGFSPVHPAGRAISRKDLWMAKEEKKAFIERIYELREKYTDIKVSTNDPLKCLACSHEDSNQDEELVFNGCGAAAVTFNVDANGTMTPCALLDIPIMNVFPLSVGEITTAYQNSEVVKNLLSRNFNGKCGKCNLKYQCGGCRARAHVQRGNYLETDPHCWLE